MRGNKKGEGKNSKHFLTKVTQEHNSLQINMNPETIGIKSTEERKGEDMK